MSIYIFLAIGILLLSMIRIVFRGSWQQDRENDRTPVVFRFFETFRRFPFAVAVSIFGTVVGVVLVGTGAPFASWRAVLGTALFLLPLFVSARLLSEKNGRDDFQPDKLTLAIATIGCTYCIFLSQLQSYSMWHRHALWTIAAFLAIALFPFYKIDEEDKSWNFNVSLMKAFASAVLSAFIFFLGILAALAGGHYLLGLRIAEKVYLQLGIVSGFIAVAMFLSAVPTDIRQISHRIALGTLFERFLRFVFMPLVGLYFVILYVYAGRIIIQGSWPKGGVAGFILAFSGVGIMAYILSYGVTATENRFQGLLRKLFFPVVLPLTPMLFLSVWRRISEYGVTETRYFGILSAFWLAAVSLYFIISNRKALRVLPASLCLVIILASFGPWGALSTSARSQAERLKGMLEKVGVLFNGTPLPASSIDLTILKEIRSTIAYLHKIGGMSPLVEWSKGNITIHDNPVIIGEKIGITSAINNISHQSKFDLSIKNGEAVDVSGYRYLWKFNISRYGTGLKDRTYSSGTRDIIINQVEGLQKIILSVDGVIQKEVNLESFVEERIKKHSDNYPEDLVRNEMIVEFHNLGVRIVIDQVNGSVIDKKNVIDRVSGVVMCK